MIKNGVYCLFNNAVYKYSRDIEGNTLIITKDKSKIDSSFVDKYDSGVYSKKINKEEIKEVYKIHTIGKVGDLKVNVEKELDESYIVGTNNSEIAKQLGLERCDKYYYQGKILKKDIIISEEKTIIK